MARKQPTAEDFEVDGAATAAPNQLKILHDTIHEMLLMEDKVKQLEEDLKNAKSSLHILRTARVPDLMTELGTSRIESGGFDIKVEPLVTGSLPKDPDKRAAAIEWLINNGGAGLIKTDVAMQFGRQEYEQAAKLAAELEAQGYAVELSTGVHAQTLGAFARERLENGEPVELETLGLFSGRVAKAKQLKK